MAPPRLLRPGVLTPLLGALKLVGLLLPIGLGVVRIAPDEVRTTVARHLGVELGIMVSDHHDRTAWGIRLPRVVLAVLVGSALGVSRGRYRGCSVTRRWTGPAPPDAEDAVGAGRVEMSRREGGRTGRRGGGE